jgi:PAS domain S-box-containing protein/diguanylate cyclase (GGDEF)-like protein
MFNSKLVLDSLYDGLYTVTRLRKINYWNRSAETITGYRADEISNLHCHEGPLKHVDHEGNDLCEHSCPLTWAMTHRQKHQADVFLHHRDGHRVPVKVKVSPLYDETGEVIGAAESFADNTEQMLALERLVELEEAALLDPLTRLANKAYLETQSQRYLREMVRQPIHIGVLVIEVSDYEFLCGRLEVEARNRLVQVVAETIRNNCRPLDLFGYFDDGCFIGLIHDVTGNQLCTVGKKLAVLIEKSNILLGDQLVQARVVVGGAILRPDDTFQSAVARCEKQLHLARQDGGTVAVELPFFKV